MNDFVMVNEEQVSEPQGVVRTFEDNHEENVQMMEQPAAPVTAASAPQTWLSGTEVEELRSRWNAIQIKFVDEPHASVEQADALVTEALAQIEKVFSSNRQILEQQWINHEGISTEDLRTSLQSYRSFFNRLLTL